MALAQGRVVNRAELSDTLGIDQRTLTNLIREGLPAVERGDRGTAWKFNTAECHKWLVARAIGTAPKAVGQMSAMHEKARKDKELADKTALQNAVTRGELVKVADVTRGVTDAFYRVRSKLLSLPSKVAPTIRLSDSTAAAQALLMEAVEECLSELSTVDLPVDGGQARPRPDVVGVVQGVHTAAEADGEPVGGLGEGAVSGELVGAGPVAHKPRRVPARRNGRDK